MRILIYILILSAEIALAAWMFASGLAVIGSIFSIFAFFMLSGMIGHLAGKWLKSNDSEPTEAEKLKQGLEALGYTDVRIEEKTEVHYKEPKIDLKRFLN